MDEPVSEESFNALGYRLNPMTSGIGVASYTHFVVDVSGNPAGLFDSWRKEFQTPVFYEIDRSHPTKEDDVVKNALKMILEDEGLAINKHYSGSIEKGGLAIVTNSEGNLGNAIKWYNKLNADCVNSMLKDAAKQALKEANKLAAKTITDMIELYSK